MGALRTWSGWKHSSHKLALLCVGASRRRPALPANPAPENSAAPLAHEQKPDAMPDSSPTPAAPNGAGGEYVVVARRYRPQTFDALIGQEHVAQALQGAITSDRVGHAYLFTGARG